MANAAIDLLLAFARKVPLEDGRLRAGHWQSTVGFELSGKTLGVLGLGNIGSKIAGYGKAFGMEVIAWSPNLTEETAATAGARKVSKEALFQEADVVSVHVRLSERSRGLVGEDELRLLGPEGVLVNTSRGPIVDEAALLRGLNEVMGESKDHRPFRLNVLQGSPARRLYERHGLSWRPRIR